jgi:DNA-binding GntR family transcriptional regulator
MASTQTKQERVYRILRSRITEGEYEAGFRLVIDRVAGEFEVSALPVREAVRRLEAEGLVRFVPNAGAQVTPADPALYEANMRLLAVLEGYATAQAAPALGKEDLAELESATADMEAAIEFLDVRGFADNNWRFHHVIYRTCGNEALRAHLLSTQRDIEAVRRTAFTHVPYHGVQSVHDHLHIIALIRDGAAPEEIERAARDHKLGAIEAFNAWLARRESADARQAGAAPSRGRGRLSSGSHTGPTAR